MTTAYPADQDRGDQTPEPGAEALTASAGGGDSSPGSTTASGTLSKTELLAALADAHGHFDAALAGLDEATLVEPGVVGAWSIKDLIGHVAAWEHLVVEALERWRQGEPVPAPSWSSADEYNAQDAARRSPWTLAQVRADAADTRRRLQALLAEVTDDEWSMPVIIGDRKWPRGAWIGGALSGEKGPGTHAAEHARQIRVWRAAREAATNH